MPDNRCSLHNALTLPLILWDEIVSLCFAVLSEKVSLAEPLRRQPSLVLVPDAPAIFSRDVALSNHPSDSHFGSVVSCSFTHVRRDIGENVGLHFFGFFPL